MKENRRRGAGAANDLSGRLSTVCGPIPEETGMGESILLTEGWTREMLEGGEMSPITLAPEEDLARDLFPKFSGDGSKERESGSIVPGGGGQVATLSSVAPRKQHIRTVCRVRPLDDDAGPLSLSVVDDFNVETSNVAAKRGGGVSCTQFPFGRVLDAQTTQERVFQETVEPMLAPLFEANGGSGVVIAYGATNAGKTFTITGTPEREGILPRTIAAAYRMLEASAGRAGTNAGADGGGNSDRPHYPRLRMHLRVAEVYNNKAYDLLRDGGVRARAITFKERCGRDEIVGLSDHTPGDLVEALGLVRQAKKRAETSWTALNARSSRSHTFWMIELQNSQEEDDSCGEDGDDRENHRSRVDRVRRLWIVDMAGSERILRSRANGQEASHINQDHSALFRCLLQTETSRKRVSYRDRTLTRLFKDMFVRETEVSCAGRASVAAGSGVLPAGGPLPVPTSPPAMFVMLVNVNPAASEYGETQKVLHNSLISMKSRPNEKRTLLHAPRVTYGLNGHLVKRHKTDHSFSGQEFPLATGVGAALKRIREGEEPGGARRSPHELLLEAQGRIAELEERLREAESRVAEVEAEARAEVQGQLIPVIDKLEVQLEVERRRHTQSVEETGKKLRRQASAVAAQKRGATELLHSACRVHERLQECEEEVTRLRAENDRLVEALARKPLDIASPSDPKNTNANANAAAGGAAVGIKGTVAESEVERLGVVEALRRARAIAAEHEKSATLARKELEERDAEIAKLAGLLQKAGESRVLDAATDMDAGADTAILAAEALPNRKRPSSPPPSNIVSGDGDVGGQGDGISRKDRASVSSAPGEDGESESARRVKKRRSKSSDSRVAVAIAADERTASSSRPRSASVEQREPEAVPQPAVEHSAAACSTELSGAAGVNGLAEKHSRDNERDGGGVSDDGSVATHAQSAPVPQRPQGAATEQCGTGETAEESCTDGQEEPRQGRTEGSKSKSPQGFGSASIGSEMLLRGRASCSPGGRPNAQSRREQVAAGEAVEGSTCAKPPAGPPEPDAEPQQMERKLRRKRAPLGSLQQVDGAAASIEKKPREREERLRQARGRVRNEEKVVAKRARERTLLPAPSPKKQATQEGGKMSKVVAGVLARRGGGARQRKR